MRGTWFTVVFLASACVGCGSDNLSPAPAPSASAAPSSAAAITGVVRDDRGAPIAGATVWAAPGQVTVLSDANGKFSTPIGSNPGRWVWVFASKPGYEPDAQQISVRTSDLTLHDLITVAAGESVRVTVRPNDPNLWIIDKALREFDYRIRIVRLSAAVTSRVTVRLVADDGGPAELVVRGQEENPGVVTMSAGSEVELEIRVIAGSPSRTFTLISTRSDTP